MRGFKRLTALQHIILNAAGKNNNLQNEEHAGLARPGSATLKKRKCGSPRWVGAVVVAEGGPLWPKAGYGQSAARTSS